MASLLFKHLATSLTRQVAQMGRLSPTFHTSVESTCKHFCTLTAAPRSLLLSRSWISPTQLSSSVLPAQYGPSLLGQCQHPSCLQPSAGMKTKSALKKRCKDCFFVRRRGRLFVFCKTNPRHKQRQG